MSLPIRVRLTAWYVAVLALIVVTLGAFVVLHFRADMVGVVDTDLRGTWAQIAHEYSGEGLQEYDEYSQMTLARGGIDQVYDADGRLLASWGSAAVAGTAIAPAQMRADALASRVGVRTVSPGRDGDALRVRVGSVGRLGQRHVLAVAEPLDGVEASTERVLTLLLLAVPAALAVTALSGWWLARKALLPVERMTSKAERIGIDHLDERIALPRARDEIGHLAVTLNAMLDRLQRGVAEKQRLVADASHELRTPLAVMRAELDVTLRGDLSPEERPVLESVREEVDHMSRTVDNLLTLAQVDEGGLQILTTPVRLRAAIATAVRPLFPLAADKSVRLSVEDRLGDGDAGIVHADAQRVHQVLTNLVENAIKFSPAGGEVRVVAWRSGPEVAVTVADAGPGIPAGARDHVFERFFRVDAARGRARGGSGLGLSICRAIAEAHGGRLWVDSKEGAGSAFTFALPGTPAAGWPAPDPRTLKSAGDEVTL
jgi:heavy metal sensor kinase